MQVGAVRMNRDPIWLGFGYDEAKADWPSFHDTASAPNADRHDQSYREREGL